MPKLSLENFIHRKLCKHSGVRRFCVNAFLVCELMAVEDLSLTEKNTGASYVRNLFNTEDRKINPRGGLIGTGHPLGATGVAQIIEVTQQLQNKAGKRQISNPKKGLVHNMSAAATSSTILVLES